MESILNFLKSIDWATISSNVVTVALLLWAAIKLYAKTFIEEKVKSGFNSALEEFKAQLQKETIAYQVDYSLYYTERIKAVMDLYSKLAQVFNSGVNLTVLFSLPLEKRNLDTSTSFEKVLSQRISAYSNATAEVSYIIDYSMFFLEKDIISKLRDFTHDVNNFCNKYLDLDASYLRTEDDIEKEYVAIGSFLNRLREFADSFKKLLLPNKNE